MPRITARSRPLWRKNSCLRVSSTAAYVLHDVEPVEDDRRLRQVQLEAQQVGFPHLHAHCTDGAAAARRQVLSEEAIKGFLLALLPSPDRLAGLEVRDHRETPPLTPEDLIDSHQPQWTTLAVPAPGRKCPLVDPTDRLRRQTPLPGHPPDRCILAVPRHGLRETPRVGMLAFDEVDPLRRHPATPAVDAVNLQQQPHLPGAPRKIPNPPLPHAVDRPHPDSAPAARVGGIPTNLPDPDRQGGRRLVEAPLVGPVSRQKL